MPSPTTTTPTPTTLSTATLSTAAMTPPLPPLSDTTQRLPLPHQRRFRPPTPKTLSTATTTPPLPPLSVDRNPPPTPSLSQDLNGRLLNVNKAAPRGSRAERPPQAFGPSSKIYVGNLSWGVDNGRLEQVFSEQGKVVEAKVIYDRESSRSCGFDFVTMSSETEVNDVIAALDGQSLDGRAIRVNVAEQ